MNRAEHIIECIGEEGCEVGQRCSKGNRFGLAEVQPEQPHTNAERIQEEVYDLLGAYGMAAAEGLLPALDLSPENVRLVTARKTSKIERFMTISREQGTLIEENSHDR